MLLSTQGWYWTLVVHHLYVDMVHMDWKQHSLLFGVMLSAPVRCKSNTHSVLAFFFSFLLTPQSKYCFSSKVLHYFQQFDTIYLPFDAEQVQTSSFTDLDSMLQLVIMLWEQKIITKKWKVRWAADSGDNVIQVHQSDPFQAVVTEHLIDCCYEENIDYIAIESFLSLQEEHSLGHFS